MQAALNMQHVQAPEIGMVASPSSAITVASLLRAPDLLLNLRRGDERSSLEREAEHLQIWDAEPPSQPGSEAGAFTGRVGVALEVGDIALVEREPAVVGALGSSESSRR